MEEQLKGDTWLLQSALMSFVVTASVVDRVSSLGKHPPPAPVPHPDLSGGEEGG